MDDSLAKISKTVAHVLRHEPWLYELELDEGGWLEVNTLLSALRKHKREWQELDVQDLVDLIEAAEKQRFELRNGRIRALYGHSIPVCLEIIPAEPPSALYHGTSPSAVARILAEGLKPMGRQYVHLSVDRETAQKVGLRKAKNPVILEVATAQAHAEGVPFFMGNRQVWLAESVPARFLIFPLQGSSPATSTDPGAIGQAPG